MALSGNFENRFRTGYTLRVEWNVNSQSIDENTSSVTVTAYLVSGGSSYTINSSATKTVRLYINGTTYTKSAAGLASLSGSQKKALFTKTVMVAHAVDGTKSINLACELDLDVTLSGTYWGTVRAPDGTNSYISATLNTIPPATTPTTSGTFNVGSAVTINTPRVNSDFTHTLQYSLNNSSWTNIATNVATSTTWTLPAALATAKTNAASGTVYIRCITYYNSKQIGTKTISRTYNITSSYAAPSVAIAASQSNNANIAQYIRSRSSVTLKATGTFKHGASAKKYVFKYGGTEKTVTTTESTASVTFTLPSNAAASYEYSVTLTDSRGFTASKSGTLTTVAYSAPVITSLNIVRGNYDGTEFVEASKGNSLRIIAAGTITSLSNANAKNYKVEYRLSNSTSYATLIDTKAASAYAVAVTEYTPAIFSENASYVLRFSLSDSFDSVSQIVDVPSQKVLLNFSANGKAMAIGGIATIDDALEIMLEAYITGGNKPMQLANGTDFDEIVKAGIYVGNAGSGNYVNCPIDTGTFLLEVAPGGVEGQRFQRLSYCSKTAYRAYIRTYYQSGWGEWFPVEGFTYYNTTGYAGQIRHANGFMIQWGRVSIASDSANTTKSVVVNYPVHFTHAPITHAHPHTSAPTVVQVSAGTSSIDGFTIYHTRTNTTATWVSWIAIGRG